MVFHIHVRRVETLHPNDKAPFDNMPFDGDTLYFWTQPLQTLNRHWSLDMVIVGLGCGGV